MNDFDLRESFLDDLMSLVEDREIPQIFHNTCYICKQDFTANEEMEICSPGCEKFEKLLPCGRPAHFQMSRIDLIQSLVDRGVLGREMCPEPSYWHWPVLRPDDLNEDLRAQYFQWGEIRW